MYYSKSFVVPCPEGYNPVARPKDWNPSKNSFNQSSSVNVTIDNPFLSVKEIMSSIIRDLKDSFEIQSALMIHIPKTSINDFIIGFNDDLLTDLQRFISISNKTVNSKLVYTVSLQKIYLFQRIKPASSL